MGKVTVHNIKIHHLKKIELPGGGVLRAVKRSDKDYLGFGEAYFSQVEYGVIKAWKLHKKMTMNLVVPVGEVHFALLTKWAEFAQKRSGLVITLECVFRRIWFGFEA